ncbi:MAG TPA: orotidine-5'-phosphate decarboxylase [Acidiferrobacteraceae bacterium]|nr:orotidine-5'-phosphate decarboxylase [Acidiferrobacteraceae bacterium]HEX20184.1 orotidine-5'-phosphate decarboxylase [Acidiferrobacteraceae bacterium]
MNPKIIVALDFGREDTAIAFCKKLNPALCRIKVGLELYLATGESIIARLHNMGFGVFLDLKFHDIPNTVAQACKRAAALGVWMINVHALGGRKMMEAAREAIESEASRPLLIGVTILTSMSDEALHQVGVNDTAESAVSRLASLVHQSGLDGVVCSPLEVKNLRQQFNEDFVLVTPGIRTPSDQQNDQVRVLGPKEAIEQGSSYLVIGRPISRADDPGKKLEAINALLV